MISLTRLFLLLALLIPSTQQAIAGPKSAVSVSVSADVAQIAPGKTFQLAATFTIPYGYHIYWLNPNGSGLPTQVKWKLPEGFNVGAVEYPTPSLIKAGGGIESFGYEKQATLLVRVTAPNSIKLGEAVNIIANCDWLECDDQACIPGSDKRQLQIPVGDKIEPLHGQEFINYRAQIPLPFKESALVDAVNLAEVSDRLHRLEIDWKSEPEAVQFFCPAQYSQWLSAISTSTEGKKTIIVLKSLALPTAKAGESPADAVVSLRTSDGQSRGLIIPIHINPPAMPK